MSMIWIIAAIMALAAGLWMARPFLKKSDVVLQEADAALSVYRDQAEEVARDLDAGLIDRQEFDAAREEIEERAHDAARHISNDISICRRSPRAVAGIAAVTLAAGMGTYAFLGNPEARDLPLQARKTEILVQKANAGDLTSRIQLLIDSTGDNPDSFADWWRLAQAYGAIGDHTNAAEAYRKAAELSGDRPAVLSAYGEAMTLANGNKVPPAARLLFEQITQKISDPRARYYLALAKAQAQNFEGALEDWMALSDESAPDAPWMALVRRDITNMARFLNRDISGYPADTPAHIPASVRADISDLEARLSNTPNDYKGRLRLAELRAGQGDTDAAAAALQSGRSYFAAAPFVLGKFDETARALGLDLVAPKGPTDAQIAAAATLSAGDQNDMIAGMVAGLSAKLEENPNNPDGWVMLVRSYNVMGHVDKAREAKARATALFSDQPAVLAQIRAQTAILP